MNLAMPRNWKIRKYRPGDEEGIFELWSVSHPERHYQRGEWLKFWDWEYKEIPDGSDIWLADDNGKIVGLKCITFRKMKFGDEIIRGVHGLDTLTHPDYRLRIPERNGLSKSYQNGLSGCRLKEKDDTYY
jgi:hypothetical protein